MRSQGIGDTPASSTTGICHPSRRTLPAAAIQDIPFAMAALHRYLAAPVRSLRLKRNICVFYRLSEVTSDKEGGKHCMTIRPTADQIKQPDRPKLADIMGPGLITGASDDDPSGIATYSQAGAQFGYSLGWTLLLTYPLMCAIQMISAQVGRVTGKGLAGNMRRHYPALVIYPLIALLLIANVINIGADLGAMAAALRLFVDGPQLVFVAAFAIVTVLLEVFMRYSRYASVLRWLALSSWPMLQRYSLLTCPG